MNLPPNAIKLNLIEHLTHSAARTQRIVDPSSGYQFEIDHKLFDLICPICKHGQIAPEYEGVDYRCPQCGWHYKVLGKMLAVWDPRALGVDVKALAPGEQPAETVLAGGSGDAFAAEAARKESTAAWNADPDNWGKKVQVSVPPSSEEK